MPTTESRAGTVFPWVRRSASPSVETRTVVPRRAPSRSITTTGSPLGLAVRLEPPGHEEAAPLERLVLARGDERAVDAGEVHQTIRSAPPTVSCRSRVKVRGVVTPSPVGVAIEKLR